MKEQKTSLTFPSYKMEEINSVVVEITDHTTFDEVRDKQMPTVLKDQDKADEFMNDLRATCLRHGFMINRSGLPNIMVERLYKKIGKKSKTTPFL